VQPPRQHPTGTWPAREPQTYSQLLVQLTKLINARSETILEKPSFRQAAVKRRALIPAEGYYEWEKTPDGRKIPNYLYSENEDLLAFAGLYEFWPDPSVPEDDPGRWMLSCTVLTTTAHDSLGHVIWG
jgi:putative SOS response-associated peptidase YedK